ncbi:hypothetical protein KVR01_005337 [Diaporthe batatas]|uniref:uncharacterized protein n=1 Tax=Diaporthe batatas TaxID=748121 RepID=UPI001D0481CA|nr:uncharacterized protein KVR01_005337 [Diaporthe batatas]KAG8165062.1 hypothetical protein KVR01_005337 [Diaporthe batatas]
MDNLQAFGSTTPFAEPLWYSRTDNPNYTESHRRLRQAIRHYVDNEIVPFISEWEEKGVVPPNVLKRHSDLGYTAVALDPHALGKYLPDKAVLPGDVAASDWDSFHDLIAMDELARCGSLGVIWALGCGNSIGCPLVIKFGTEEQKSQWLPPVVRGEARFSLGCTEPQAGSDVAGIVTTAEQKGNVFVVNGTKHWVTNGMTADYCTAVVRTGVVGRDGISVLVIPLNSKGVTRSEIHNSGVELSGCASLKFDNVEVPVGNIIGEVNRGFKLVMTCFNHERLWIATNCLRLARVCVEDAYQHALTRQTFGKPLIERQLIRLKFANVGMQVTSTYALIESLVQLWNRARLQGGDDTSTPVGGLCAMTKVNAARALELAVRESQQIMGALGYTRGGPGGRIERISRDMRVLVIGGGSDEILSEMCLMQESKDLQRIMASSLS